jgi:chromatin remodeling complex protein RSC6
MVRATATKTTDAATKTKAAAKTKAAPVPKTKAAPAAVPVPTPIVEAPVTTETDVAEPTDKNTLSAVLLDEIASFNKNYASWQAAANAMKMNIKNIAKISARVSKNAEKSSKKKRNSNNGAQSGFQKPTLISDELAVFFNKPKGTRMARTEVSKEIHKYVTSNNLQNKENRRIIHPDAKLKKLLDSKDEELTYFNLQKYLKHHFKKDVSPTA